MAVIRNLVVKIGADISNLSKGLKSAQQQLDKISKKMNKVGNSLTKSFTLPLMAFATLAVKASSDVENSMFTISKSFNSTGKEIEDMTTLARKMSASTIYGINEVAGAMNYLKKAGYSVAQMQNSLLTLTNLATASDTKLEQAVSNVVKVLGQFNLGTEETNSVSNVMSATISRTSLTLDELTTALVIVGKTSSSVNYSIESMSAAIAILSNAGFNAEESGSFLKSIIQQLETPTTTMQKILNELGLSLEEINPKTNSLADILKKFANAGLTSSQATEMFGEKVDSAFMSLLTNGADNLEEFTKEITDTNSAQDEANKKLGTLSNQLKLLKNDLNELLTLFGQILLPTIKDIVKLLTPVINALANTSDKVKRLIVGIGAILVAIGPVIKIVAMVIKLFSYFSSILSAITSPIGLVVIAIAAVIAILIILYKTNEEFRKNVEILWNQIKDIVSGVISDLKDFWDEHGQAILSSVKVVFQIIWTIISTCFNLILKALQVLFTYVQPIWEQLKKLFLSLWNVVEELYELLKPIFEALGFLVVGYYAVWCGFIEGVISALGPFIQAILDVYQIIVDVVGAIVSLFKGDFSGAFEHIKNIGQGFANFFSHLWEGILNFGKGFVDGFVTLFNSLGIDIVNILSNVFISIGNFFTDLWAGIKSVAVGIWDTITGVFRSIGDWFVNLFEEAFNWGKNLINMIGNGIKSAVNWVKDACSSVINKIKGWLGFGSPTEEGPGKTSDEWAPNLMDMYSKGIELGVPDIESAVSEVAEALANINEKELKPTISTGETSISSDILNGLLSAMSFNREPYKENDKPIELSIDGTVFARLIYPSLTKEFKRNGMLLKEGGFLQ